MQNNLPPQIAGRILVIDDDADMCWSLKRLLRSVSFDVTTADCGYAALERLKEATFDIIILDARLPDIPGLELAQLIRGEADVMPPIILISGYLYLNDRVVLESLQSGLITNFISKPFFHNVFLEIVCNKLRPVSYLEGVPET
jgi:two-component system response regulator HydG